VKILATRVGWVERSDIHRLGLRSMMGIGAQRLNPSYNEFLRSFGGIEGDLVELQIDGEFMKKPAGAICVAIFLIIFWSTLSVPSIQAQEENFYKGKTIRVLVGTTAGSLYDLWARAIAAHIGRHIPGNPETLVQNMPGAGHKIATNYLYNVAKPDGLTVIGSILPGMYMDQLVGRAEVKYDWAKFVWIGSPVKSESQMTMRADAPYKSVDDIRNAKEPARCGSTGTSGSLHPIID
jgi:tripartite-type tricarboxylate transporter receptor subunit TctC